jgi:hypothetical protein
MIIYRDIGDHGNGKVKGFWIVNNGYDQFKWRLAKEVLCAHSPRFGGIT